MGIPLDKLAEFSAVARKTITEQDKQQHFWYSFAILASLLLLFSSVLFAITCTLSIGLAKEIWDEYYGSGFCWFDMAANFTGVAAALLCLSLIHLLLTFL